MTALLLAALLAAAPDGALLPGSPKLCVGHTDPILAVAISPDGSLFAAGAADSSVRLWDAKSRAEVAKLSEGKDTKSYITALAFSPDGTLLAVGDSVFAIAIYDVKTKTQKRKVLFADIPAQLAFSPDGTQLAVGGEGATGQVFSVADGKPLLELRARSVAWSKDGKRLLTTTASADALVYDLAKKKPGKPLTLERPSRAFSAGDFSKTVTWTSDDPQVALWDLNAGKKLAEFTGHKVGLTSAALSSDGTVLITASKGQFARVWTVADQKTVKEFPVQHRALVAISNDKKTLIVGDGVYLKVWDTGL